MAKENNMNSFTKHNILLAGLALTLWQWQPAARAATPDKPADTSPDPVVATGKGFEIKNSQVEDAFQSYNANVTAKGSSIPSDKLSMVRSNLLQQLIITKILTQKATAADKTETMAMVDGNIAKARKAAASPAAFDAQLKARGLTLQMVRERAGEDLLCRRVLQRETTNGIMISDAAVKKFYDDNPDKFEVPEEVRASHILISTLDPLTQHPLPPDQKKAKEQLAKELKARAEKGEDFAKLAKQYSEDPGSKDKGGEYTFPRGRMVPEFEAAAFSLKTNQISDIVETKFGYHIIKLLEKFPAKHEQFAEVQAKIKDYLIQKKAEDGRPAYFDKIKAEYHVALVDPNHGKLAVPAIK
jgi:peptidyl-prolyl cis-trans isomerase C